MSRQLHGFWRFGCVSAASVLVMMPACAAHSQESPTALSVYGGSCTILIVNGAPSAKPCIGTLMVNGFSGGSKTVIFHNTDDEAIAFQAIPRQGMHYGISSVEVNGQSAPATGACTIALDAQNAGEIRCEARAGGRVTSGTFQVTALKHRIGGGQ